ncbi:MAG: long-chain fatty acid--CoA ligase [Deltaproteobacteria bacterium]|nr:long-chain fatty acid--CoA ligase [Deltaproteobacteria bacterium]
MHVEFQKTPLEGLIFQVKKNPNGIAYRQKIEGQWQGTSWKEYYDLVEKIAAGLVSLGVQKGDRIAILSATRPEWALADVAILTLGAVTVPIYYSNTPEDVHYILEDARCTVIFVENQTLRKKIQKNELLRHIISFEKNDELDIGQLHEKSKGIQFDLKEAVSKIESGDLATLVYTSGTTGKPKGVMLTHDNFLSEINDLYKIFPVSSKDSLLTFLPFAHIFARVEHMASLCIGWCLNYAESIEKVATNMKEVRPTLVLCVPRIFEKAYNKILIKIQEGSSLKKALFAWASKVGRAASFFKEQGKSLPFILHLQWVVVDKIVFSKIRENFGGRIRFFISGGAPLSQEIARFFHSAGLLILEGYGLTETTAAVTVNLPHQYRFGTVGLPVGDVKIKIEESQDYPKGQGEILLKSRKIFRGYFNKEEETCAALRDGWFATGDVGTLVNGHLMITDRKKDIIVTSSGKNIAPQNLENLLKTNPLISQAMVYGDNRNYLTALITLNQDQVKELAATWGLGHLSWEDLIRHDRIKKQVSAIVNEKNAELASYETIKKFQILENDFSIETGELTPTLKVKRKFCSEKYRPYLDSMYQ